MPALPPQLRKKRTDFDAAFSIGTILPPEPEDAPETPYVNTPARRRLLRLLEEWGKRKAESLRLYCPLPQSKRFHSSQALERILVGSNRASKTLTAAVEVVWTLTGLHPWRRVPKSGCKFSAVGFDWGHVGLVMWPKIGLPGAFSIIRDELTRQWRPVLPDQEYDAAYREKWRDAPPLLPEHWIKDISWESAKDNQPKLVETTNGGKLMFSSSKGAAKQGDSIHGWWCDEELENERWVSELRRACVEYQTGGFYSATPLAQSVQFFEMIRRANDSQRRYNIEAFKLSIGDNIYLSSKAKQEFYNQLVTPEEIRVRWYGEPSMSGLIVYPEFTVEKHAVESFQVPPFWTRYMIVDPGVQVCAVLFAAVPPQEDMIQGGPYKHAHEVHIYDELYIERCTARIFAERVAQKMGDARRGEFEAFIIDHSMGRQSDLGSGATVESQYTDALNEFGVYSRSTGSGFMWGTRDVQSREEALRRWLMDNPYTGHPTVRIHSKCHKLLWELPQQYYKKDKSSGLPTDKRRDAHDHATSCLEYLADLAPEWVPPQKRKPPDSWAVQQLALKRKQARQGGASVISLGPKDN